MSHGASYIEYSRLFATGLSPVESGPLSLFQTLFTVLLVITGT